MLSEREEKWARVRRERQKREETRASQEAASRASAMARRNKSKPAFDCGPSEARAARQRCKSKLGAFKSGKAPVCKSGRARCEPTSESAKCGGERIERKRRHGREEEVLFLLALLFLSLSRRRGTSKLLAPSTRERYRNREHSRGRRRETDLSKKKKREKCERS